MLVFEGAAVDTTGTGKFKVTAIEWRIILKLILQNIMCDSEFRYLIQNWIQCPTVVNMVMNLWIK